MSIEEAFKVLINRGHNEAGVYIADDWREAIQVISDAYKNGKIIEIIYCNECCFGREACGNIYCNKPGTKQYCEELHPLLWFCPDGVKLNK